jgi:hypothetical protein
MKKTLEELVEFYKKLLESVNLYVTKDGYIKTSNDEDGIMLTTGAEGKPLVLPTEEHRNSLTVETDGKIEVIKTLFNPLQEDAIKVDSASLEKLLTVCKRRLAHAISVAGKLLLMLAKEKELQTKTGLDLNQFLARLNEAKNSAIKNLVDDTVLENWDKLYELTLKQSDVYQFVNIYLKKGGKAEDNVKYHRLATVSFPIYDEIVNSTGDTVLGVKLRNKEKKLFRIIFEYLIPELNNNAIVWVGSNDVEAPGFVALMSVYHKIGSRLESILKQLKFISELLYDSGRLNIDIITPDEILLAPTEYKAASRMLPSEQDLTRKTALQNKTVNPVADINNSIQPVPYVSTTAIKQQQQQQQQPEEEDSNLSLVNKILGSRNPMQNGVVVVTRDQLAQQQQQQQPMYQPQPIVQQQPIYQQPMYQQPVYQQQQPVMPQQQSMFQQPSMYQQPMYQQQPMFQQPGMFQQPNMYQQPMYQQQPMFQQPQGNSLGVVPLPGNANSTGFRF